MPDEQLWIVVPNWERFQHYGTRTPPWIKLYLELNSADDWLALTCSQRGLLVTIWAEYARSRGTLKVSSLHRLCTNKGDSRHLLRHLEVLCDAGFIELSASKPSHLPLALARSPEQNRAEQRNTSSDVLPLREKPANESKDHDLLGTEAYGYALRLVAALNHKDDNTLHVVTSYVGKLPPAAFETVREKLASQNGHVKNDAAYAVAELKRMTDDGQYA